MKKMTVLAVTLLSAAFLGLYVSKSASAAVLASCGSKGNLVILDQPQSECRTMEMYRRERGQTNPENDGRIRHRHQDDRGMHNLSGRR